MSFVINVQRSLGELTTAIVGVLADAWVASRFQLLMLFGLAVVLGFVPYTISGVTALMLNELVPVIKSHAVSWLLIELVFLGGLAYLVQNGLQAFSAYYTKTAYMARQNRYEMELTQKLATLDVATHENPQFKDELQVLREQGGSHPVAQFVDSLIHNTQNVVGVVTASAIVLAIDWRYFALILIASIPQFYTELRYGRGLWSIYATHSEDRRLYDELNHRTTRADSIRQLQTFQIVPYFIARQRAVLTNFLSAQIGEERKRFGLSFFSQLLLVLVIVVILLLLIGQVARGELQLGTFSFILGTTLGLEGTITAFLLAVADQRSDARAVAAFYAVLAREPFVKPNKTAATFALSRAPRIEFRNVTFSYASKPDEEILSGFSLTVEPGERLALVGSNGAGKSTLIKLLCRFYDPTEGAIFIDGVDLRDINQDDWYRYLALLSQEFDTYEFKVWENIRLGRFSAERDQEKIEQAARQAQANLFIEKWRCRYDQQIGAEFAGGVNLSGGQRQKLALARALYRQAFVTVLDEPTAHVDADSERLIFEHLNSQLTRSQTLILISHRFSTVRNADRICVIENGRVSELGSHGELVALKGTYAGLFEQQAQGYR